MYKISENETIRYAQWANDKKFHLTFLLLHEKCGKFSWMQNIYSLRKVRKDSDMWELKKHDNIYFFKNYKEIIKYMRIKLCL